MLLHLFHKMTHQSNQVLTNMTSPHESSLAPTQPTSKESDSNNTTVDNLNSSYQQTTAVLPSTYSTVYNISTISSYQQTTVLPNTFNYNNHYGCRTILASKRVSCKTKSEYFHVFNCMYTGCEGTAQRRTNVLLDNKHSTVTLCSIKTVKKTSS